MEDHSRTAPEQQSRRNTTHPQQTEPARYAQEHWHWHLFDMVAVVCVLFVILTGVAMLVYPGGSFPIPRTHGYQFFINYFSDLGQTHTQSGAANYLSMSLFTLAVASVGAAVAAFFVAFRTFFQTRASDPTALRRNRIATRFGIASGVCFVGIASIPENVFAAGHFLCVQGAFDSLFVALILEILALRHVSSISRWLRVVNSVFVSVLFCYILLLIFGPSSKTLLGDMINAVGQKIIVYVALATIFAQALLVRAHLGAPPATTRS